MYFRLRCYTFVVYIITYMYIFFQKKKIRNVISEFLKVMCTSELGLQMHFLLNLVAIKQINYLLQPGSATPLLYFSRLGLTMRRNFTLVYF
jgi:hypothetical protein